MKKLIENVNNAKTISGEIENLMGTIKNNEYVFSTLQNEDNKLAMLKDREVHFDKLLNLTEELTSIINKI